VKIEKKIKERSYDWEAVNARDILQLEGLGKLKKFNDLIRN
jgi:hypothetical protein